MNKPRYFESDTYHHLYNRGVNKQSIFFDKNDYEYFIKKMIENKIKYQIEIIAFCLMPNHFHIFIHQTTKNGLGSKFISDLINSYTKTINKKYKKTGVLFETRTKNKIVYSELDFKNLTKYILLNPVKAGLVNKIDDWEYSSAKELISENELKITDKTILNYFNNIDKFTQFIESDDIEDYENIIID